jgi:hypothetical protein
VNHSIRTMDFEALIGRTAEALSDPNLLEELGALGIDFMKINEAAFLPNIRRGKIIIPKEHRDTDGVAVVPVSGSRVRAHSSMFLPTVSRRHNLLESTNTTSKRNVRLKILARKIALKQPFIKLPVDSIFAPAVTVAKARKMGSALYSSRPIIFTASDLALSCENIAPVMTHEYVHAGDIEAATSPLASFSNSSFRAYTEARAYYASGIVAKSQTEYYDSPVLDMQVEKGERVSRLLKSLNLELPASFEDVTRELVYGIYDQGDFIL